MKKILLFAAIVTFFIACVDENQHVKLTGSTLYKEIKMSSATDTSAIRFVFENEGNSTFTGKVACSKDTMLSNGDYIKIGSNPLKYYFKGSLYYFDKEVIYYQIDSLTADTFRVKITFPDYTETVGSTTTTKKDTLVYKAFKYQLP